MPKTSTTHGKYKGVIVSKTDFRKLNAKLSMTKKEITDFILFRFEQIGEEAVKIAREKTWEDGSFHDVTGNLRSSIGYVILIDGKIHKGSNFEAIPGKKGDGTKGSAVGQSFISKLQSKFPWGIVLIICAGMEYAAFVENIKHKDVLTSAEHLAESLMKKLLGKLISKT